MDYFYPRSVGEQFNHACMKHRKTYWFELAETHALSPADLHGDCKTLNHVICHRGQWPLPRQKDRYGCPACCASRSIADHNTLLQYKPHRTPDPHHTGKRGGGYPPSRISHQNSKGPESFTRNFWFSSTKDQEFSEFPCLVPEMVLCISASTKDEELEKHRTKQQEFRVMNIAARGIIYKEER